MSDPAPGAATGASSDRAARRARGGRIEVICGCMFAGKTGRLIERLLAAQARGQQVVAFKHTLDRRYAPGELATHDERHFPATALADPALIESRLGRAEIIGIDEAQFFGLPLVAVCQRLRAAGREIIAAGIDYDTWGRPFSPLPELRAIADDVELMDTPCRVCGSPARFSQRMVPVVDGQMVGGPQEYEPRCAACFVPWSGPPEER